MAASETVDTTSDRPDVTPMTVWRLPHLAYRTAGASWIVYVRKHRRLSARRLCRVMLPNLRRPIFIMGAPRSGTTFLGECLAELPEVSYHFEPIATKAAVRCVYDNCWSFIKARWFFYNVYAWLMRLHLDGDLRFAEKTPRNLFILPFLRRAFPGAQFVHIIRDGRDCALSHSKQPWLQAASAGSGKREPGGYLYGPEPWFWVEPDRRNEFRTTSDIHRCIWAWRRHMEAGIAHTGDLPPEQYHELRYEALVDDPQHEGTRLLDFLGIDRAASRARLLEALAGARPTSVGGWRRQLAPEQMAEIRAEAGDLLDRLGYAERASESAEDHAAAP